MANMEVNGTTMVQYSQTVVQKDGLAKSKESWLDIDELVDRDGSAVVVVVLP